MNERDGALVLPAALGSGAISIAFLPVQLLTRPQAARIPLTILDAVAALGMLTVALIAWRAPRLRGSALLGALTLFAVATTAGTLFLVGDPQETFYVVLLALASGAAMLSRPWLATLLTFALTTSFTAAWYHGFTGWTTALSVLFVSAAVAFLIQTLRRQAIKRDEALSRATRESEERYRSLVQSSPDAILVSRDASWTFVNDAAVRLFGAASREALALAGPAGRFVREDGEMRAVRLDGARVPVEILDIAITWDGAAAQQSIVRDLTPRRAAEAERREVERLRELDRVKTRFLNSVSHELRTPLTPMRMQLHILRHPSATPEARAKAIDVVDRNVVRMGGLVEDLLEVARVEAGRIELKLAPMDLRSVIDEAVESFEAAAEDAGLLLMSRIDGALPVLGDARRLTQVMYNLVGNALKFTPRGGRILVHAWQENEEIVVNVEDNGSGLASGDVVRLFEPFTQAHDPMERTHSGTGLGLYISRGFIEAHGGSIKCESDGVGLGARFVFRLPLLAKHESDLGQRIAGEGRLA